MAEIKILYPTPGSLKNGWRHITPEIRLEKYILRVPMCDCWLWIGPMNDQGYGLFGLKTPGRKSKMQRAHRVVYEKYKPPIPAGLDLDHICRVRHCVNPDHLEPVTKRENLRRSPIVNPSTCIAGHPFSIENTRWIAACKTRGPSRHCKLCEQRRGREKFARDRAKKLAKAKARA